MEGGDSRQFLASPRGWFANKVEIVNVDTPWFWRLS